MPTDSDRRPGLMKPGFCSICLKDLHADVPIDAENIECYACYNKKRRAKKDWNNKG